MNCSITGTKFGRVARDLFE